LAPSTVMPSTLMPSTVMPSTVMPSTLAPSTLVPSTLVAAAVVPGHARPLPEAATLGFAQREAPGMALAGRTALSFVHSRSADEPTFDIRGQRAEPRRRGLAIALIVGLAVIGLAVFAVASVRTRRAE